MTYREPLQGGQYYGNDPTSGVAPRLAMRRANIGQFASPTVNQDFCMPFTMIVINTKQFVVSFRISQGPNSAYT